MSGPAGVGIIGLGQIGRPLALRLLRAGTPVAVWARRADSARLLLEAGATSSVTPADLARACPVILTVLPDLPDVEALLDGDDGLLAGAGAGSLLVVMGTVSPVGVQALAVRLRSLGVAVVDAPVSGGDVGAQEGTLSVMAGGEPSDVARVADLLAPCASSVRHMGPVGSGQLTKACNQIVVAATLTALAEAVVLARQGGLDVATVLDVLAGGLAGSRALEVKRDKLQTRDFRPGGSAAFQHKDLGFALAAARDSGTALPLTALVDQLFGATRWAGHGDEDHSSVLRVLERLSGLS